MSLRIAGTGWVTPLGRGVDPVWQRLLEGDEARAEQITDRFSDQQYNVFRVPETALTGLPPHSRLRRASPISRFAVAAGLDALEQLKLNPETAKRIALVFAISNGGVIYTKRFYHDIVESGAQSASPLLFPETVFNAPASHLAAILGITGATYTVIGDGAVGVLAIKMAEDLMANEDLDYCLVVGAEEIDWLLCDAYRKWRLLRLEPPVEPFSKVAHGMILSEGAGAVLLGRDNGAIAIEKIDPGGHYQHRSELEPLLKRLVADLASDKIDIAITSANGTFIDKAESNALSKITDVLVYSTKPAMGESVGAVGLWQTIVAAKALLEAELPPLLHSSSATPLGVPKSRTKLTEPIRAIVLSCGMNQQVAGLRLIKA